VLLHRESSEFLSRHPEPADIALLIEVADTSIQMDRETKRRLYARCGVQTYCIVDIPHRRVIRFTDPVGDEYKIARIYELHESVPLDSVSVEVRTLFE
jgi:hypothetical protein